MRVFLRPPGEHGTTARPPRLRGAVLKGALLGAALCAGVVQSARADSDGHFCVSSGYVAYELRGWSTPEGEHVLKIIRVGGDPGIADPSSVTLTGFQVHGMRCTPQRVTLLGWDKRYVIELEGRPAPTIEATERPEAGPVPEDDAARSFRYVDADSMEVPSDTRERTYRLHLDRREASRTDSGPGGEITRFTTVRLVERDRAGEVTDQRVIHEFQDVETID